MAPRALILGGIGSGKSTVAHWFQDTGAVVISADDLARAVLAPGNDATAAVGARWPQAARGDGTIDRAVLGRIVFTDPAELAALEAIVHPATRAGIFEQVDRHSDEFVLVEVPLLRDWFDDEWIRVVVDAPDAVRVSRATQRDDGRTEEDVRAVMALQPDRSTWLLAADYVIDNRGDRESLAGECVLVWEAITGYPPPGPPE